jgi:tagatose 6-phosphate kinase
VIVVVALNPALDITHEVPGVDWDRVNRPESVHVRPGGKGVNVARMLAGLGAEVTLLGLVGGRTGEELTQLLAGTGVTAAFSVISGETRRTFTVVDTARGEATLFSEPGPRVGKGEYPVFFAAYEKAVAGSAVVVLSGSLPRDVPDLAYAELVAAARAAGVPAILDTSGAALALGAAAGPAVVKPNLAELGAVTGRDLGAATPGELGEAARQLGETVVVSLGADGLLAVTPDGSWLARPGERVTGNPTGAGDAVVAGLADGLARGLGWPERLRHAVALGAAAVAAPAAGEFDELVYRRQLALASDPVAVGPHAAGGR